MFNKEQSDLDLYYQEQQQTGDGGSYTPDYQSGSYQATYDKEKLALYMAKVMGWMCAGLLVTLLSAVVCLAVPSILFLTLTNSTFRVGIFAAQLILVVVFSFGLEKMSAGAATVVFLMYSAVTGVTMSVLALVFEMSSIISVFGLTAFVFFAMSLYGYNTKKDLTGLGSLCFFGLIGIIAASLTNYIVYRSAGAELAILCIGIVLFIGLVAFDAQKIKDMYVMAVTSGQEATGEVVKKMAIYGALALYLDFINLFIRLLAIFGKRRN